MHFRKDTEGNLHRKNIVSEDCLDLLLPSREVTFCFTAPLQPEGHKC